MAYAHESCKKRNYRSDLLKCRPLKKRNGVTAGLAPHVDLEPTHASNGRVDEHPVSLSYPVINHSLRLSAFPFWDSRHSL